jgi:hypothetical protein
MQIDKSTLRYIYNALAKKNDFAILNMQSPADCDKTNCFIKILLNVLKHEKVIFLEGATCLLASARKI